jgi:hypothetical protein
MDAGEIKLVKSDTGDRFYGKKESIASLGRSTGEIMGSFLCRETKPAIKKI